MNNTGKSEFFLFMQKNIIKSFSIMSVNVNGSFLSDSFTVFLIRDFGMFVIKIINHLYKAVFLMELFDEFDSLSDSLIRKDISSFVSKHINGENSSSIRNEFIIRIFISFTIPGINVE